MAAAPWTDKTRYTMLVKEAITRTHLVSLQQRTTDVADRQDKPANFRKDMVGVDADLDIRASRVNLDANPTKKQLDDPLVPDYKSDPKQRNTLRAVLAGSNRAPDRLKAAKICSDDTCDHPDCDGARATTEHINWVCHHHKQLRLKHSFGIGRCMRKAYQRVGAAYRKLVDDMKKANGNQSYT